MRCAKRFIVLALVTSLPACDGGSGNVPPPTSGTPSPSPTATSGPVYSSFPLTSTQRMPYASVDALNYNGRTFFSGFGISASTAIEIDPSLATATPISIQHFVVLLYRTFEDFLAPSTSSLAGQNEVSTSAAVIPANYSTLTLLNNVFSGTSRDAAHDFKHLSYARWVRGTTPSPQPSGSPYGDQIDSWYVFGFPTLETDKPSSGSRRYSPLVMGHMFDKAVDTSTSNPVGGSESGLSGTAILEVSYASRQVSITLELSRMVNGVREVVGTFVGTPSALDDSQAYASGTLSSAATTLTGRYNVYAFGPQATEIGVLFELSGQTANSAAPQRRIVGLLAAK